MHERVRAFSDGAQGFGVDGTEVVDALRSRNDDVAPGGFYGLQERRGERVVQRVEAPGFERRDVRKRGHLLHRPQFLDLRVHGEHAHPIAGTQHLRYRRQLAPEILRHPGGIRVDGPGAARVPADVHDECQIDRHVRYVDAVDVLADAVVGQHEVVRG